MSVKINSNHPFPSSINVFTVAHFRIVYSSLRSLEVIIKILGKNVTVTVYSRTMIITLFYTLLSIKTTNKRQF